MVSVGYAYFILDGISRIYAYFTVDGISKTGLIPRLNLSLMLSAGQVYFSRVIYVSYALGNSVCITPNEYRNGG